MSFLIRKPFFPKKENHQSVTSGGKVIPHLTMPRPPSFHLSTLNFMAALDSNPVLD